MLAANRLRAIISVCLSLRIFIMVSSSKARDNPRSSNHRSHHTNKHAAGLFYFSMDGNAHSGDRRITQQGWITEEGEDMLDRMEDSAGGSDDCSIYPNGTDSQVNPTGWRRIIRTPSTSTFQSRAKRVNMSVAGRYLNFLINSVLKGRGRGVRIILRHPVPSIYYSTNNGKFRTLQPYAYSCTSARGLFNKPRPPIFLVHETAFSNKTGDYEYPLDFRQQLRIFMDLTNYAVHQYVTKFKSQSNPNV